MNWNGYGRKPLPPIRGTIPLFAWRNGNKTTGIVGQDNPCPGKGSNIDSPEYDCKSFTITFIWSVIFLTGLFFEEYDNISSYFESQPLISAIYIFSLLSVTWGNPVGGHHIGWCWVTKINGVEYIAVIGWLIFTWNLAYCYQTHLFRPHK
jgi:hypothetical protein